MKKFYLEALIVSAFIGIFIRAFVLVLMGQHLLTSMDSYFFSALIAMISCSISFIVHVKVLTNNRYSFMTKYAISSILIFVIYLIGNLYFGGLNIVFQLAFYGYAIVIVLVSLPLIYHLNKRIITYNDFLNRKKSQNAQKENRYARN